MKFSDKGIKRNEFCFRISNIDDMKNVDKKIARLKNRDRSLYTEDNSLIAKYKVGKQV